MEKTRILLDTRLFQEVGYSSFQFYEIQQTAVGTLKRAHRCQLKPETLGISRFYLSLDPPKSPLRRGTLKRLLSPPS